MSLLATIRTTPQILPGVPTVELIDPAAARNLLAFNTSNRNLRKQVVAQYARDMAAGRWEFSGEAVKIARNGTLLDGQHRLAAIVEADVEVAMVVVRGLDPTVQKVMDTGARRTAGDALSLAGQERSKTLAAVAKIILNDAGTRGLARSTSEIMECVEQHPELVRVVEASSHLTKVHGQMAPSALAYSYWRLDAVDRDACGEFFGGLNSLVGLPGGSPIIALNTRLSRMDRGKGAALNRDKIASVFVTWNAWRRGETRQIIRAQYDARTGLAILPVLV